MDKSGIWIVIAAYNEEKRIGEVVKNLKESGYENCVVVDDGSYDKTFDAASKQTPHVLKHIINRGQGATLKTGIDYALQNGAEYIVTFDADGQHRTQDLPAMLKPVMSGEVDVTIGSRFLGKKSNIPFMRKIILKGGIMVVWMIYGIKLTDSHNGFRVFSRSAAKKINMQCDRMEHASEIVDEIKRNNLKFREIPVIIKYTEYSKARGQSSWNAFRILYKMIVHKLMR